MIPKVDERDASATLSCVLNKWRNNIKRMAIPLNSKLSYSVIYL